MAHARQRAGVTGTLSSCLSRGIWRETRPGHVARAASEITSLGNRTPELKLTQGSLSLPLGCPRGKGSGVMGQENLELCPKKKA